MNIAVLASHAGTTLQAVIDACQQGVIPARIGVVISNNPDSGALQRAEKAGIETRYLSSRTHPEPENLDHAICQSLIDAESDLILLAGYMKRLGRVTLRTFEGKIINTHPALLPKFGGAGMYGRHVHRAVLASGDTQSGPTIHLVEEEYDTGPIIAQVVIDVLKTDTPETLAERVQTAERQLLVQVLAEVASGYLKLGQGEPLATHRSRG